jgi:hypothetical protein
VAKHLRRRWRGSREQQTTFPTHMSPAADFPPLDTAFLDRDTSEPGQLRNASPDEIASPDESASPDENTAVGDVQEVQPSRGEPTPDEDWFGPSQSGDESYAARRDVSLASMLMLGSSPYQRIDGMGLARKALETAPTGDPRQDISMEERGILANARAWCLLVHGDLGHRSRLDDPFVLADAERFVEMAAGITPGSPSVEITVALLRLRQGRAGDALESAQRAIDLFARIPEHQRGGRTQGAAILAVVTQALVVASLGDCDGARMLSGAARAVVTPLDLDEAAFLALLAEVDSAIARTTG